MALEILIVDDEKDIADLLAYNLQREGFTTRKAYDGEQALALLRSSQPSLILLDLMLPGIQGIEVCRRIRKNPNTASIPTIMLTAKGDESDKVLGLETGADDYITKPFSVKEVLARIRAVLRRTAVTGEQTDRQEIFRHGGLIIDFSSYEVRIDGDKVELSPMEFKLLKFLCRNPGRVYSQTKSSTASGAMMPLSSSGRWTSTFEGSGSRSRKTLKNPSSSIPCAAWVTSLPRPNPAGRTSTAARVTRLRS